jgi:BirA family biotin operon repressor/biotin-[acetyl-CoA-carboxylase] ligase
MTDCSTPLLIDPARLQPMLGSARGRFDVDSLPECESTNTLLLQRALQGAPSGSVVVTDRQTAGRGSRGRTWLASPESSLTFSVLWRFALGPEHLAGLSLAAGVAVVRALAACGAAGVVLKWPNDILYADAKLGGILVELQTEPDSSLAVVGIGLNLGLPDGAAERPEFALPATALDRILSPLPERHVLFARLLGELADVFDRFAQGGFAALRTQWQTYNGWQDRPVRLLRNGSVEMEGICRGADVDGALLVQTDAGTERCISGDLSLRPR